MITQIEIKMMTMTLMMLYLLIGFSTDFGSGPDRVTGPKALKPQGLLMRGLTCIS